MANIGIDITPLCTPNPGGIGSCLYETLRALERVGTEHRLFLYGTSRPYVPFSDEHAEFPWPTRIDESAGSNLLWMQTGLLPMLLADAVDLFWGTRNTLPIRGRFQKVVTIHDFWYHFYPSQQPLPNLVLNALVTRSAVRHADLVAAISYATAADARRLFALPESRVSVVQLGVDAMRFHPSPDDEVAAVRERLGLSRPFLLAMDVYNARKNFEETLRAFAALPAGLRAGLDLVALGRPRRTARPVRLEALAAELGIAASVKLPGDVAYADLPAVYTAASALVFPSVYEGFGMPLLEAMACGCPVVTSSVSSLPEVAGEAALLVDPSAPAALAAAIERVLTGEALAVRLREAGFERAASFTWERTAEGMLRVFDEVLHSA